MSPVDDDEMIRYFCAHFVALGIEFCPLDAKGNFVRRAKGVDPADRENSIVCVSGFVMDVEDHWFLVTAGHILSDVQKVLSSGQEGVLQARLLDFFGLAAPHSTLVPIEYKDTPKYYEWDEAKGIDFGFIHLRPLIRENLLKNNIVPIDRRMWVQDPAEFECYFMIGLPTELIRQLTRNRKPGSEARMDLRVAMIPVQKLDAIPAELQTHSEPLFVGKIPPEESGVSDIAGMSGGPIIGVRRRTDGSAIYAVVAVQSSWYRTSRVILAYPFPSLARRMELELRTASRAIATMEVPGDAEHPAL